MHIGREKDVHIDQTGWKSNLVSKLLGGNCRRERGYDKYPLAVGWVKREGKVMVEREVLNKYFDDFIKLARKQIKTGN